MSVDFSSLEKGKVYRTVKNYSADNPPQPTTHWFEWNYYIFKPGDNPTIIGFYLNDSGEYTAVAGLLSWTMFQNEFKKTKFNEIENYSPPPINSVKTVEEFLITLIFKDKFLSYLR